MARRLVMKARTDRERRLRNDMDATIAERVQCLMEIEGQAGLAVKVCLLAGLTENEAAYFYNQEICGNSGCCSCHKLHVSNKKNGITIVVMNWTRDHGRRRYFALLPTILWERFRELTAFNEADIKAADKATKRKARIKLSCVCKIFYTVMRKMMDSDQIDILSGKAKPAAANHCLLFGLHEMIAAYIDGWASANVILPVV